MSIPPTRWSVDELIPFGKYILLNKISAGATAAVYRAKIRGEAGFERLVTIKRILPQMAGDPEFVETFVREAKICARLSHANICPIYELGKVGESLYMALEWVAGKDLRAITRRLQDRGRAMPPLAAAWIASRLCDALDYAHGLKDQSGERLNILHQDLSPANIVVSYDGAVKLLDFGIARATGRAQQTNVDALKQKLGYMSPESVLGAPVDRRSDLFGVGVCLYEMVTGKRLFAGRDDIATLKLLRSATVPPPSALQKDTPDELEQIILRALARDPEARWPSAGEMAHALTAFVVAEDPAFGTRNLAELMQQLFEEDRQIEQAKLHELLTASHDARLIEQRRRFFASPLGAAAIAKAEATRRLASTRPPPDGAYSVTDAAAKARAANTGSEPSITDSHISERRAASSARAPGGQQEQHREHDAEAAKDAVSNAQDEEPTTYRPPVLETPRPGAVAKDGLTTAASYDELIRRSAEEHQADPDAEPTMYRPEPSTGFLGSAAGAPSAGTEKATPLPVGPHAKLLQHDAELQDLQNELTVFDLDPSEYSEPQETEDQAPQGDHTLADAQGTAARDSDIHVETELDFDSEATNYLGEEAGRQSGQPAAALALFASGQASQESQVSKDAHYDDEATHIFFSAEEGVDLPELPDDELTTVASPSPLQVPPPAGAVATVSLAAHTTGAHAPISDARAVTISIPPRTHSREPNLASSSLPPRFSLDQRGPLLWVIAVFVAVVGTGLVVKTPLGIKLGLRKPAIGIIEVRTTPSVPATVRLDGIYRGRAPLRLEGVPAGKRVLSLQADGYQPVSRNISLEGGAVVQQDISLSPTDAAQNTTDTTDTTGKTDDATSPLATP